MEAASGDVLVIALQPHSHSMTKEKLVADPAEKRAEIVMTTGSFATGILANSTVILPPDVIETPVILGDSDQETPVLELMASCLVKVPVRDEGTMTEKAIKLGSKDGGAV